MKKILNLLLCISVLFSACVFAADGASLREQTIQISKELRDPGAVNQSLYDSNAPQAAEMKAQIYRLLEKGQSREQIFQYFSDRYGRSIRYEPAVEPSTAALWLVPGILLAALLVTAVLLILRRRKENS